MISISDPRLQRGAGLLVASAVVALLLLGANRSIAAVNVANAALFNLTVAAGTDSAAQALPSGSGNPTLLTVVQRTANDNIRGIASIALAWNTPPQSLVWTGTARGLVVGGEATAASENLGSIGPGVTLISDNTGGNLNRFKIHNTSGISITASVLEVW
jgi:hypothetical protein